MNKLLIIGLLFLCGQLFAQTKEIAHKSHSGANSNYKAKNYTDNLGLPNPDHIDKVEKLDDSTVVIYTIYHYSKEDKVWPLDTIRNTSCLTNPKRYLDSLTYHNMHFISISNKAKYIGFKKQELKTSTYRSEQEEKMKLKYEKKNSKRGGVGIIFLLILGGVGLTMLKKKKLILPVIMLVGTIGFSQTKEIAHKSHSGSSKTFKAKNYLDNLGGPKLEWAPMGIDSNLNLNAVCLNPKVLSKVERYNVKDVVFFYNSELDTLVTSDTLYNIGNESQVTKYLDSLANKTYARMNHVTVMQGFEKRQYIRPNAKAFWLRLEKRAKSEAMLMHKLSLTPLKTKYNRQEKIKVKVFNPYPAVYKIYTDGRCSAKPRIMMLPNNDSIIEETMLKQFTCGLPTVNFPEGEYEVNFPNLTNNAPGEYVVVVDVAGKGRVKSTPFIIE